MKVQLAWPKQRKFDFISAEGPVQVENRPNKVVVRAARSNISDRRKAFFIRHLAAEGFIPDAYQRFSELRADSSLPVQWLIDREWLQPHITLREKAPRQVLWTILVGWMLWLAVMLPVLLRLR